MPDWYLFGGLAAGAAYLATRRTFRRRHQEAAADAAGLTPGGGLSHFVGEPRVGDIDEEFDRWFLDQLGRGDLSEILAVPNDVLAEAGNGTGEVRAWVALAAAMGGAAGEVLASARPGYEFLDWGGAHHVGGGSHGSLHANDSNAVLIWTGTGPEKTANEQWSLRDIVPMVTEHFGVN